MTIQTKLLFVCGNGGVGKTSCAVGMAIALAQLGKKTMVVTIDPARRLADALHIHLHNNDIKSVALQTTSTPIDAMMLDAKAVLHKFAQRHSPPQKWKTLEQNTYFQFATEKMGSIQEMMAIVQMMELLTSQKYDYIIVDTPPAQNAVDFFTSPQKIEALFSHKVLEWLGSHSTGWRGVQLGKKVLTKGLGLMLGEKTVEEMGDFFQAFQEVAKELAKYAHECHIQLYLPQTEYWLITNRKRNPHHADKFRKELLSLSLPVQGIVYNKDPFPFPQVEKIETPNAQVTNTMEQMRRQYHTLYPPIKTPSIATPIYSIAQASLESLQDMEEWAKQFHAIAKNIIER